MNVDTFWDLYENKMHSLDWIDAIDISQKAMCLFILR